MAPIELAKFKAASYGNNQWACRVTQESLCRHPAGNKQYGAEPNALDNAQRVRATVVLDPYFNDRQATGLYVPPGEVVTIEIPEIAKGKLTARLNIHSLDLNYRNMFQYLGKSYPRLPRISMSARLDEKVNTIGWPLGGVLSIEIGLDAFPNPIEINVSGCVLTPWFRYGVTTDEEWKTIRNYPGIISVIESGNIIMQVPSNQLRWSSRPTEAMALLRSCAAVMNRAARPQRDYPMSRPNGRLWYPCCWWFDTFVPNGAACADRGGFFSCYPNDWFGGAFNVDGMITGGAWGAWHEMGHHHQFLWAFGQSGEVSNNALVVLAYSYLTELSAYRVEGANGAIEYNPWQNKPDFLHMYAAITTGSDAPLRMYIMLMYCFGRKLQEDLISAHQSNKYYHKDTYGWRGSWLLTASKLIGLDMRKHIAWHGFSASPDDDFSQSAADMLDEWKLKPFYPIANIYQTGYIVNGVLEETTRPFRITGGRKFTKIFNFTRYTKWRNGHGEFEMGEIEGREGAWEKLEPGVWRYTPLPNKSAIDEWRLTYHEKTTDQTIITYGKIEQLYNVHSYERYGCAANLGPIEAYRTTVGRNSDASGTAKGINVGTANTGGAFVVVCKGQFIPEKSGNYTFYAAPDEMALFYLSEKPLTYDPDVDKRYLLLNDNGGWHSNYMESRGSEWRVLRAGRPYHFSFVIYNTDGNGGGKLGYKINNTGNINDIPNSRVILPDATLEDFQHAGQWYPEWIDIDGIDDYGKSKNIKPKIVSVIAPKEQMNRPTSNLIDGNTNDIYTTKFSAPPEPFPHNFTLGFDVLSPIDTVTLSRCDRMAENRDVKTTNLSIFCDDVLIYSTPFDSKTQSTFTFPKVSYCNAITYLLPDNQYGWGGVCFRELSASVSFTASHVIPITHSRFKFNGESRTEPRGGYYNGIGKYISAGGSVEFEFAGPLTEFVLLGDKWEQPELLDQASVYVNGVKIGQFTPDLVSAPAYGSKLWKAPVFVAKGLETSQATKTRIRIEVESGEIGLTAVLIPNDEKYDLVNLA